MNAILPQYTQETKALLDLNNAFAELCSKFTNPESHVREIAVAIQVGVTNPKFVYALGEYNAEAKADSVGNLTLTLYRNHTFVIEYHSDVISQQDIAIGGFADAILHWLINNDK